MIIAAFWGAVLAPARAQSPDSPGAQPDVARAIEKLLNGPTDKLLPFELEFIERVKSGKYLREKEYFERVKSGTYQPPKPPKLYPWDRRELKCFLFAEAVLYAPSCRAKPDWPDAEATADRLGQLFMSNDLELIQRGEDELGFSRAKFPTGEYHFQIWYDALVKRIWDPESVDAWKRARGNAGYVPIVESQAKYAAAWKARGGGYARTVTPEGWELYGKLIDEANGVLDGAEPRLKEMGPWYAAKLSLALQRNTPDAVRAELLTSAMKAWPDYVSVYTVPMTYALPQWGGSFESVDTIARSAVKNTEKEVGAGMYPLVYERQFSSGRFGRYTLPETPADWKLMKQGIRDLEARGLGSPDNWKGFASLACQMRDRDEARRLYVIYDGMRKPATREPPGPCRNFAMATN